MPDLIIRAEDAEERELAAVDTEYHAWYGPESGWQPWQRENYLAAIDEVHAAFQGQVAS